MILGHYQSAIISLSHKAGQSGGFKSRFPWGRGTLLNWPYKYGWSPPGGVLPYKGLMGTCGQPGYVFQDFCLKQGIEFIIFCLNQGIDLSIFVLNRMSFLGR